MSAVLDAIKVECPSCEGKKKVIVNVTKFGTDKLLSSSEVDCTKCEGTGKVTGAQRLEHMGALILRCKCGTPSGKTRYHGKGECFRCYKSHYHCQDCGKIMM